MFDDKKDTVKWYMLSTFLLVILPCLIMLLFGYYQQNICKITEMYPQILIKDRDIVCARNIKIKIKIEKN